MSCVSEFRLRYLARPKKRLMAVSLVDMVLFSILKIWLSFALCRKVSPLIKIISPIWAEQTDAMHQLAVWTMLEDAGMGASLQHYNPLIDDEVRKVWNLSDDWKLIAQMPFGVPVAQPGFKEVKSLDERVFEFTD